MVHEGGCLCGEARYKVCAQPLRPTVCHCRFCQRSTGAAFLVEPIFRRAHVALSLWEPLRCYQHRSGQSGSYVSVNFCGRCGSALYLSFERFPDLVGICAGSFDDPNWFDFGPGACRHICSRPAQKEVLAPAGIAAYEAHAINADGQANKASIWAIAMDAYVASVADAGCHDAGAACEPWLSD